MRDRAIKIVIRKLRSLVSSCLPSNALSVFFTILLKIVTNIENVTKQTGNSISNVQPFGRSTIFILHFYHEQNI